MKRFFTIFALALLFTVAAYSNGTMDPVRISVTTNVTPATSGVATIDLLSSDGGTILATITKDPATTDDDGVLSFIVNEAPWLAQNYNKDYLVRVSFDPDGAGALPPVVLSIERLEVVYAKQGLFGILIDPGEMAVGANGNVLTTSGGVVSWAAPATNGTVTSVTGTPPIASSGGNTPAISINAATTTDPGSMSAADKTKLDAITGTNTGDNAVNSLYSSLVSNATHTGDATGSTALTVVGINSTLLSGLATGILKNTNGTGVPSIAVAGTDYLTPTGNGSGLTSITGANVSGNITGNAGGLTAQYIDWTSGSGGNSIANKPDLSLLAPKASPSFTGTVTLNGATSGTVGILAAGTTTAYTLTLPPAVGTTGQVLTAGATPSDLTWTTPTTGTVTSFSAGDLSPLFTTTEATTTTTPALSFSLNTQAASTVLAGPNTGVDAAPTFRNLYGIQIGTPTTHYSAFESDGTLVNTGDATTWKDINVGAAAMGEDAGGPALGLISGTGVKTLYFTNAALAVVYGCVELQHDYKNNSAIFPHLHWLASTTAATNVEWNLEYWIIDRLGNVTTGTLKTTPTAAGTAWARHDNNFDVGTAISTTNLTIGCQIAFKLFRSTAGLDTYSDNVALLTFGIHYECDTQGSRGTTAK